MRFEKKTSSHEALLELACALIGFCKVVFIYGLYGDGLSGMDRERMACGAATKS